MKMTEVLKEYTRQTAAAFGAYAPVMAQKDGWGAGLAHSNEAQLFYATGGIFTDCELSPAILNVTIQPAQTLANLIPVTQNNNQLTKHGFITQITEGDNTLPEEVCDFGPTTGDVSLCTMTCEKGRYSASTKTIELDAIIKKAHHGVTEDFFLIGNVRGVSAIPSAMQINDADFVKRSVIRRQISLAGRKLQRSIGKAFWSGDKADPLQNTAGGGRVAFNGLDILIDDDYASKPGVTGRNCAALNSDVKDFPFCTNGTDKNRRNILDYLEAVEHTLWSRASAQGLLPTTWAIVMRPNQWFSLTRTLPCQQMGAGCSGVGSARPVVNDGIVEIARQKMIETQTITLNGHVLSVILDDFIPYTSATTATGYEETSTIYFVPIRVAGQNAIQWELADYSAISNALSALPGNLSQLVSGYSDGGRFHWAIAATGNQRCWALDVKIEPCLQLLAPQLAGKITNVRSCMLQNTNANVDLTAIV